MTFFYLGIFLSLSRKWKLKINIYPIWITNYLNDLQM